MLKASPRSPPRLWKKTTERFHTANKAVATNTGNAKESIFAGVRLRTAAVKRQRRRDNPLYLVFKIVERLSRHWRALNGGVNLMALVLEGCTFKDGILPPRKVRQLATIAA